MMIASSIASHVAYHVLGGNRFGDEEGNEILLCSRILQWAFFGLLALLGGPLSE